ncbi:acetyltransferase (GNAT) family protein [Aliiruegeria haliotis]|uniref:Acetyltransferase (GNAT) family protein n=1 Tax=Aliiruegeria haliotis TaxID=1280846 RepID=A0A2T0S014_9RHOB|nr:GNAT family N-acetyltransferase [Aliiruegeria haliotis]PRY26769.1 acetyltransferase (GNAT) family protein [Aliiruegeria haliotis]
MAPSEIFIRPALPEDADQLAVLVNQAGEGMPLLVWQDMAEPGEDPWQVGRNRVRGTGAGISHRNGWVAMRDGALAGCLFGYTQPERPPPLDPDMPAMFRPLAELENAAPGTGYVYVLSTVANQQGRGVGTALLAHAERYRGPNGMSLIVSDGNPGAMRLYSRCGYVERARLPMVKDGWDNAGSYWILMVKD